jgi:FK506-binding protein 14
MMFFVLASMAALLASPAAGAGAPFSVTQTDGPTDCDEKTAKGHYLKMHYTGSIDESSEAGSHGKVFDSSVPRKQTFDFRLGGGQVISGWDEGLVGLCKGAKATLVLPPDMGYGARGAGADIPGGATLRFDVEVVDFSNQPPPAPPARNLFKELDTNSDNRLTEAEVLAFFKGQGKDELPPGMWDHEDKNGDGFISWAEFSGPKGEEEPEL